MNILITSASRKVSLVKAFRNAIALEGGGKVFAADSNPLSATFYFSDKFFLLPPDSSQDFIDKLLKVCKKNKVDLLIPTRDEELEFFSINREKFKKVGTTVLVSSTKTIRTCVDKKKFFEFCKIHNIKTPYIYSARQVLSRQVIFPLFINGRISKGSRNAFLVNNEQELNLYLKTIKNPIVQEYIQDKEYTIDLFADFKGRVISVVPRERIYTFGGESFISKTYRNEKLIKEAIRLSKKLNLIGHNTLQCFFDGNRVRFFEVNPRYGGGASLGFAAGANTPLFLIKILKNKKIEKKITTFKNGLVMLRYTEDYFIEQM